MPGSVYGERQNDLNRWSTNRGEAVGELSERRPVLLVFLRHAGCPFCREAMADLARQRKRIELAGVHIVLVHMNSRERFRRFAARYGIEGIDHIANPGRELYRAFGLKRGSLRQIFGWEVWKRGIRAVLGDGYGIGLGEGDAWQMSGAFLLHTGSVIRSHEHCLVSDRLNYYLFSALPFSPQRPGSTDVQVA